MKPKAYLLLLSTIGAKTKITPDMLKEVRRILGPQTCPIMAWEMGATIGFISTDTARQTTDKIRDALGGRMQIMVAELGSDQSQWGLPHHHEWLARLEWMTGKASEKSHQ